MTIKEFWQELYMSERMTALIALVASLVMVASLFVDATLVSQGIFTIAVQIWVASLGLDQLSRIHRDKQRKKAARDLTALYGMIIERAAKLTTMKETSNDNPTA